jgi:hypothetical protein
MAKNTPLRAIATWVARMFNPVQSSCSYRPDGAVAAHWLAAAAHWLDVGWHLHHPSAKGTQLARTGRRP